ncbi:MAG: dephospho-CoA kinase [bacterium TMED6]|nr:MAG: dephospho-CoA kinase [bacterium TMED6]|tara:strand:- start:287 stop:874 length:588 start_codon:yes stop_codon:yes gene_type:complete
MITIGITGNIGSGKTTLSKLFESKNTYLFNADKEAKKHLKKHSVLQRKIINVFGNMILSGTKLDFKKLAEVAFKNQKNQKILNGIVWPEVSLLIESTLRDAKKNKYKYFVVDAALLFEANFNHFFDYIILVTAEKKIRLERALKRKTMDLSQIKKRMTLQMSDNEKIESSDFIIYNNLSKSDLTKEFEMILKKII